MYKVAILTGVYSYTIFALGLSGFLNSIGIGIFTALFLFVLGWLFVKNRNLRLSKINFFEKTIVVLIAVQIIVNLVGVISPELSFDALWYHLTIPKMYLVKEQVFFIPGGLFYYSAMPKLVDMLYIPAIFYGSDTLAKFIHFLFGVGCLFGIYNLSKMFVKRELALLACLIFYSNLVVMWLSTAAYTDLAIAFYVTLAVYYLIKQKGDKGIFWLIVSAIMMGFAITVKISAAFSLLALIPIVYLIFRSFLRVLLYVVISGLVVLPWLIFAFLSTGNPIYPFLSLPIDIPVGVSIFNIFNFIHSTDPVSPVYIIFLPLIVLSFFKLKYKVKLLALYCLAALIFWFLFQTVGSGRYAVPFLPILSVLCICVLNLLKNKSLVKVLIAVIVVIAVINILYRSLAQVKYLPVVFGFESKKSFLSDNLDYSFGDFYDVDGYFKNNIGKSDNVLTFGIHNLYYVDFPFTDGTFYKLGSEFTHVLVRGKTPDIAKNLKLIYQNKKTNVRLYKNTQ